MSGEHDWYLSLMTPEDMIAARKHIPGIPSDTRNPKILEKLILDAFNRAYKPVGRGGTNARISIRDFYSKCAEDYLKRNKQTLNESLETFILTIGSSRVRPYTKVALFFYGYPDKFELYLPQIKTNKEEGKFLFEGIIDNNLSNVEKIAIMLEFKPVTRFNEQMQEIEEFAMEGYPEEWRKIEQFVKDAEEIELYNQLSKLVGDLRWLGLFCFLKNKDQYKNTDYETLLLVVQQEYAKSKLDSMNQKIQSEQHLNRQLEEEKNRAQAEYGQKSQEIESLKKVLEETNLQVLFAQEQITRTSTELSTFQIDNQGWEYKGRLYDQFVALIKEKYKNTEFTFLSDNKTLFPAQFCDGRVVESLEDIPSNTVVFVDRSAYLSSTVYLNILQELETRGIQYEEIIGYDELDQLRQVIDYNMEEIETYE